MTLVLQAQFFFTILLVKIQPFDNVWLYRLELFNEIVVLTSIYFLYFFMGLIPDPEICYEASLTLTYIMYSVMSINFIVSMAFSFVDIRHKYYLQKKKEQVRLEKELLDIKVLQ